MRDATSGKMGEKGQGTDEQQEEMRYYVPTVSSPR